MSAILTIEERLARIEAFLGLGGAVARPPVPWALRRSAVLREAARLSFVSIDDLLGESRIRPLVVARAAVVVTLRADPPMSYSEIGRIMHRDHSSIINLERIGWVEARKDNGFAQLVDELKRVALPPEGIAA